MTLKETLSDITSRLTPAVGAREASAMAEAIMEHLKGYSKVDLILNADREVSDFIASKIDALIERLLRHEPLQYVIGETMWHGLKLRVTPDVLIPRPETSELVDFIVDDFGDCADLRVLDLCTGSGCIALALARHLRFASVTAVDVSDAALEIARENSRRLHTRVDFRKADVLTSSFGRECYDIVVSNPPYVLESERTGMETNVLDYEPALALFVPDTDPLRFYHAIERIAADALVSGGRLYFEINPLEADALADYMKNRGWENVTILSDISARKRFLIATKPK